METERGMIGISSNLFNSAIREGKHFDIVAGFLRNIRAQNSTGLMPRVTSLTN